MLNTVIDIITDSGQSAIKSQSYSKPQFKTTNLLFSVQLVGAWFYAINDILCWMTKSYQKLLFAFASSTSEIFLLLSIFVLLKLSLTLPALQCV